MEKEMEGFVDHYIVLGLHSGEEGLKLSEKEISKAYKLKALDLHPDKRPDDPDAHDKFQKLKRSHEVLKDEKTRKAFDDLLLRVLREKQHKKPRVDSKRRKMKSDLKKRERSASAPSQAARLYDRELKVVVDRIRANYAKKRGRFGTPETGAGASVKLDKERALKVSWETAGEGYTAGRLREVFSEFGEVEDVVIRSTKKKKCSAFIVMATKDGAVAATRTLCGDLSNPLLVVMIINKRNKKDAEREKWRC